MHERRISTLLWERARPLFATLDAARAGEVKNFVSGAVQIGSFYAGKEEVELREVAPYLVAAGENPVFLERWLMRAGAVLGEYIFPVIGLLRKCESISTTSSR
jgi:hypothetical protein